jgi:hypothetical protein
MHADNPISGLMFFTLAATVFIIAGAFIYFLRSRTNREIAARALEGNGSRAGAAPSGAGPELIGFAVIAIAVMGLPATGYNGKSKRFGSRRRSAAKPPAWPNLRARRTSPNSISLPIQPPDTRSSPTSSDTGVGSNKGATGQPK